MTPVEKVINMVKQGLKLLIPALKSKESKFDVKETKEALIGVNEVAVLLVKRFKDGVGFDDGLAIWDKLKNDDNFKAKVMAAYEGYSAIPAEIKDIDGGEGLELVEVQLDYIPQILAEFQEKEAASKIQPAS